MQSRTKISFVVPAYNRADLISDTLDSLIAQTESAWEAIVVDDNSTDNTAEIVQAYTDERIRFVGLPTGAGSGVAAARNYGNLLANSPLIAVLDSDDIALPERAQLAIASFESKHWDLYSTSRQTLDMRTGETKAPLNVPQTWDVELFKQASFVTHSTVVYTKEAAMEIPYNSALDCLDDYDLISRFIALGKTIVFDPAVTAIWRRHDDTLTGTTGQTKSSDTLAMIRQWRGWSKK